MTRYRSIDAMRTIAIVLMVLCHFTIYLAPGYESAYPILFLIADHGIGDFAAPFFVFLAGMSQQISYRKHLGDNDRFKFRPVLYGAVLFIFGLVFERVVWGHDSVLGWDVLTLIAAAIILLFFLRRVPTWALIAMVLLVMALSPMLRSVADYLSYWGGELVNTPYVSDIVPGLLQETVHEYEAPLTVIEALKGFSLTGFFPVFPWVMYAVCGFIVGRLITSGEIRRRATLVLSAGCVLVVASIAVALWGANTNGSAVTDFIAPLSFYPMSSTLSILALGFCLVLFPLLWLALDRQTSGKARQAPDYIRIFGKYSLTVYVGHHIVIMWPVRLAGYLNGTDYYMNTIDSALVTFIIGAGFLVAVYYVLRLMDRKFKALALENLLSIVADGTCSLFSGKSGSQTKEATS